MRGDPAQMSAMIVITITVGGIITIIVAAIIIIIIVITARTAITITAIAGTIITTIITIATMTIDDVAFTESCCRRARRREAQPISWLPRWSLCK
jgi:hypothetical protein